jgi:hypothetical protein
VSILPGGGGHPLLANVGDTSSSSSSAIVGSNETTGSGGGLHLNRHPQNSAQTVVLVRLPPFLRSVRSLRDASHPCGTARTVHVGCCIPDNDVDVRKSKERGLPPEVHPPPSSTTTTTTTTTGVGGLGLGLGLGWEAAGGGIAVVKLGHYGGARDFAGGMLVLARCGNGGRLPDDGSVEVERREGGDDGDELPAGGGSTDGGDEVATEAGGTDAAAAAAEGDDEDKSKAEGEEAQKEDGPTTTTTASSSKYGEKEEADHLETLRQLKDVRVHHLYTHHIPDPVPPDMDVPQPDPVPDPAVPVRLLEALTAIRLRYEESAREAADLVRSGRDPSSASYVNDDQWGGHAAAAGTEDGNEDGVSGNGGMMKLDTAKLAAAAGGVSGYDEEADPLNAPDVIKAVMAFKRQLEDQNTKGKRRRIEIVNDRMARKVAELLEVGRREREERQLRRQQQQQQLQERALEEKHQAVVEGEDTTKDPQDTGRRGVSNLPAWMTKGDAAGGVDAGNGAVAPAHASEEEEEADDGDGKKRKFVPSEANRDVNARRQKLDVEGGTSLSEIRAANEAADAAAVAAAVEAATTPFAIETTKDGILSVGSKFPPLPSSAAEPLKRYVTSQIVDYLGEEESTLIEFVMKELSKVGGCTTLSLLEEMKMVLDEESEDFVLGLYRKMLE